MEPHSCEPQDEICDSSFVLMCSDNWIWDTGLSIQMVTKAVILKKEALQWRAVPFHFTAE